MSASYRVMLLLILPLVMAPVLVLDGWILHTLARQSLSAFHPSASGTITHSEVVRDEDSYGFEARYAYEVGGRAYEGSRYRHGAWSSSNRGRVEDLARRFPVGASVPVFYDPESPGDGVLITGVDGMYLFLLMFMTPFNMVMLMGVRHVLRGGEEGRLGVFKRAGRVHVRLTDEMSPLAVGTIAVGCASFVSMFVLAIVMSVYPSLMVAVLAWVAVIATGVIFAKRQHSKLAALDPDLILDERNQMLSVPSCDGRRNRLSVPWSKVKSVFLDQRPYEYSDEGTMTVMTLWCPTLEISAKPNQTLAQWSDKHKAALLVKWLQARLPHAKGVEKV
ncbi:hypothetical protein BO221_34280 [Archangium sp. Cb G35]|uniref:DUF3592 domain-containing protein n=1 Tax=Archangium sp. Cb G35 TaxID=1920190 RepID=UPI000937F9FD|nr:DUF3592 domain-containing protein [Archangium sp. Cb G35]OJT19457.1 hypothetical protein BO221_34280 [Archangium sp. Cb G35]